MPVSHGAFASESRHWWAKRLKNIGYFIEEVDLSIQVIEYCSYWRWASFNTLDYCIEGMHLSMDYRNNVLEVTPEWTSHFSSITVPLPAAYQVFLNVLTHQSCHVFPDLLSSINRHISQTFFLQLGDSLFQSINILQQQDSNIDRQTVGLMDGRPDSRTDRRRGHTV